MDDDDGAGMTDLAATSAELGPNLLSGDAWSFEGGTTGGYVGSGISLSNTTQQAQHGTRSLLLAATASPSATVTGPHVRIPFPAGARLRFGAWFRPTVARNLQLALTFYGADGFTPITTGSATRFPAPANVWTELAGEIVVPRDAATFRLLFYVAAGTTMLGGETHYLDNITVRPIGDYCMRRAWLVLGDRTLPLEDEAAGYFCPSLELGWPVVREVTNNLADRHGIDDRTRYFGGRTVTAEIVALRGARARIDEVASMFAPFMSPAARPELHYVLDRPGYPERSIVVRAAGYAWPIVGADERRIQLQWIAPDPFAYDPDTHTLTLAMGTSGQVPGRGDVGVEPFIRINGPANLWEVRFYTGDPTTGPRYGTLKGLAGANIAAGWNMRFAPWDRGVHLYYGNLHSGPRLQFLDWNAIRAGGGWPYLPPYLDTRCFFTCTGSVAGQTQAIITWSDNYLT